MKFNVNKIKKRKLGLQVWYRSFWGKFFIGLAIVLIVVGIIIYKPVYNYTLSVSMNKNDTWFATGFTVAIEATLLLLSFLSLICSYRQIARFVSVRGGEELTIKDGVLNYQYGVLGGWANSDDSGMNIFNMNVIKIILEDAKVSYYPITQKLVFTDSVYFGYVSFKYSPEGEPSEPRKIQDFEISLYFEPDLNETIKQYVKKENYIVVSEK